MVRTSRVGIAFGLCSITRRPMKKVKSGLAPILASPAVEPPYSTTSRGRANRKRYLPHSSPLPTSTRSWLRSPSVPRNTETKLARIPDTCSNLSHRLGQTSNCMTVIESPLVHQLHSAALLTCSPTFADLYTAISIRTVVFHRVVVQTDVIRLRGSLPHSCNSLYHSAPM